MAQRNRKRAKPKKKGKPNRAHGAVGEDESESPRTVVDEPAPAVPDPTPLPTPQPQRTEFLSSEFQHQYESRKALSPMDDEKDSLYVRYKKSTQRLKVALESLVPPYIFQTNSVDALMDATDYIVKHDLEVDRGLLSDIKVSIRVRQRMAVERYAGGDEGHAYFIRVLVYCWSHLRRKCQTSTACKQDKNAGDSLDNQFKHLSTEHDGEDDDDDDDSDLPDTPPPRPTESGVLTLEELLYGSCRADMFLFLFTLNDLMASNALMFSCLKDKAASTQSSGRSSDDVIPHMMWTSAAANFSMQQVESLEEMFIRDNPHLNTVYRVFAYVTLVSEIHILTGIVAQKSPIAAQFSEKHAIEFLGDAIECWFRSPSDPLQNFHVLVPAFLRRWRFPNDDKVVVESHDGPMSVNLLFNYVLGMARVETELKKERDNRIVFCFNGRSSYSWLDEDFPYIGENRSISHTIHLLQHMSRWLKEFGGRMHFEKGYFGDAWDDLKKPVSRIQVNMDELLMRDIMPTLISLCGDGMMGTEFPYQEEIFSAFTHVKAFVKHPERPVSWTMAFSIHTILTAIFETQESKHRKYLARTAQRAFDKYIEQLEWAENTKVSIIPRRPPIWDRNIKSLLGLVGIVLVPQARTSEQKVLSLWNPYCAGTFLLYTAYHGNLVGGAMLVDTLGHLRQTLHLFNALKQQGAIKPGQIEVLDEIFETFKDCKAIWDGKLPVKGEFQARWLLAYGISATYLRETNGRLSLDANALPKHKMTPIDIADLSRSFRRICLRDFRGVVDEIQHRHRKHDLSYRHSVRMMDLIRAVSDDTSLLGTNLTCLGYHVNEFFIFFCDLFSMTAGIEDFARRSAAFAERMDRDPHWDPTLGTDDNHGGAVRTPWTTSVEYSRYNLMSQMFGTKFLQPFDDGDMELALQCAGVMEMYFNQISPETLTWFKPTRREDL